MGDVHTNLGFVRTMRIAWRVGFYVTSLAIAVWLGVNLFGGKYFGHLGHFLPTTVTLFVVTGIVYAFAFRVGDGTFTNLNLSVAVLGVMFLASEVGIRVWDRYNPIFRPVQLEDNIPFKRHDFSLYRPGGTGSTHGQPVRINALGFTWGAALAKVQQAVPRDTKQQVSGSKKLSWAVTTAFDKYFHDLDHVP